ncbi:hypothetical protein PV458_31780 [Streptomyces sp. MN03-5084-2B]|nr:hypothetical protein [Streptomyces sp. MN03-5084-2B]
MQGAREAVRPERPVPARPRVRPDLPGHAMLALQRQAGNAAVSRLIAQRCGDRPCACPTTQQGPREEDEVPVQRFGSGEHVRIGTEAVPGRTVLLTGFGHISYGEMIALGDYFGTLTEMSTLASAFGTWGREQIDYALWKVNPVSPANPTGRPRPVVSPSAVEAVDARYYRLASRNETHFSTGSAPGLSNREQYIAGHTEAIRSAYLQGLNPLVVRPWTWDAQEGFAAHFLTDAFSAGHVRTPRGEIQRHWEALYPNFRDDLIRTIACHMATYVNDHDNVGYVATVDMLTDSIADYIRANSGPALAAFSIGDLISKVMHDADNAGLDVVSPRGPAGSAPGPFHWRAVGDDFLFPSVPGAAAAQTARMAEEATKLSYEEGARAFTAGTTGSSTLSSLTNATGFQALGLVPNVDPASATNPVYPWSAPSITALGPVLRGLIGGAFLPGKEIRAGLDAMAVPATTERYGFTLHTGDAWNCFKGLLLADPFAMIARIGARDTCPAGKNSPC